MVRSSTYRQSKYDQKLVGDVQKNRIDAQRDSMVQQATTQFANLAAIETSTKNLLVGWGVSTALLAPYMSFARECYGITRKHAGAIAVTEICIAHAKWATRGLDAYYMQVVANDVFSVDITSCT